MMRRAAIIMLFLASAPSASAGYYSSLDNPQEVRWDRDFRAFNVKVLIPLGFISTDKGLLTDSPMRQRYVLIDSMSRDGNVKLTTWQQKLNLSAVLIRRGKAYEATQVLQQLSKEQPDNFLVWAHLGSANFLSGNSDFRANAADCLRQSLALWPKKMEDMDPEMQAYLKQTQLENDFELERFRKIEEYFKRLVASRVREDNLAKKKKPGPEGLDTIFLDEESKEDKRPPVSFLNEEGKFDVGRISRVEKAKLPRDAVECVEQLLIWMPTDQRLLWLLGEVINASVMDGQNDKERHRLLRSAEAIFRKLHSLENPPSFASTIKPRWDALSAVVKDLPEENALEDRKFNLNDDKLPPDAALSSQDWWRTLLTGIIAGAALGMFAIWQLQEMRRRRQRATKT